MPISQTMLLWLVPVLGACVAIQFFLIVGLNRRFARQSQMLRQFFTGPEGEDLEELLSRNLQESHSALVTSQKAMAKVEEIGTRLSGCVQHFALVRYDAFDEVTGQLSFSLALLDGRDNGAVVTAIFGRSSSRCYGKMIIDGQPEQPLTQEEQKALFMALERKIQGQPKGNTTGNVATTAVASDDLVAQEEEYEAAKEAATNGHANGNGQANGIANGQSNGKPSNIIRAKNKTKAQNNGHLVG